MSLILPQIRITRSGALGSITPRIIAMLKYAEKRCKETKITDTANQALTLRVVKGGWLPPDPLSSLTATKSGHADLSVLNIKVKDRNKVTEILRASGFCAWRRTKEQGFDEHIHLIDPADPQIHPQAARQVLSFYSGRDGLTKNEKDTLWRPKKKLYFANANEVLETTKEMNQLVNKIARS